MELEKDELLDKPTENTSEEINPEDAEKIAAGLMFPG